MRSRNSEKGREAPLPEADAVRADHALQRSIADACFGHVAGDRIVSDLRGFLADHGVDDDDIEAIAMAPRRLAVYRSLVRSGIGAVVLRMLPRTVARMNAAQPDHFEAELAAFVDAVGPATHYLRDVPAEFCAWATPRWRDEMHLPPYLADLARYELAGFQVAAAPSCEPGAMVDIALDRPLATAESARLLHFDWAVHTLPASGDPLPGDVFLLAYRDHQNAVRWLELTPLAASVLGRVLAGEALGDSVTGACAEHGVAPADVGPDIARLFADLAAWGVILGARTSRPP